MDQHTSFHFILIEDSKLDSFIGEKIIQGMGTLCRSLRVFLDPQEALVYISHREPDQTKTIVLLDIQMPLMSGFEFIEHYEEVVPPQKQTNYVINVLSSSINEKDIIRAGNYRSVNTFLSKPLTKEMILDVVESLNG